MNYEILAQLLKLFQEWVNSTICHTYDTSLTSDDRECVKTYVYVPMTANKVLSHGKYIPTYSFVSNPY